MAEKVKCPGCRGAKIAMKLGGMMGDCNLCDGVGKVEESKIPKLVQKVDVIAAIDVIEQVAESQPHVVHKPITVDAVQKPQPIEDTLKLERRKAVYKHKRG